MTKGDILHGLKNLDGRHRLIYLAEHDEHSFIGAMLTHSGDRSDNIPMAEEHFEKVDSNGVAYEFRFDDTYVVGRLLFKKWEWAPFKTVGRLTRVGVQFVESKISETIPVFWEDYHPR